MAGACSFWPLMALLAAAVVFLGLACNGSGDGEGTIGITLTSPTPTPITTPAPTATPTPTPTPTPNPKVCGVNPDPAPPSVLQVQEPQPGQQVKNPFHVRGWGSEIGFEQRGVVVALVDAQGNPLPPLEAPPQTRANRVAPPGLNVTEFTRPFAVDILRSELEADTSYCLWVFLKTDEAGRAKGVVQVPVVVTP
jgi:hypothetical protein